MESTNLISNYEFDKSRNSLKLSLQKFGRTIILKVDTLLRSGAEFDNFKQEIVVPLPNVELIADIQSEFERTQEEYISKKIPDAKHLILSAPLCFSVWDNFVAIEKIIANRNSDDINK